MWASFLVGPLCTVGCILIAVAAAAAEPARLSGETIKSTLAGAIFELDTPLGTKVPVRFSSNGLMAGEAGALASVLGAERDRGRWWVANDRLCMKWFRWFDADTHCFSLRMQGKLIHWEEQGGRSGTATIAGRFEKEPVRPVLASAAGSPADQQPTNEVSRFASAVPVERPPEVTERAAAEPPPAAVSQPELTPSLPQPMKRTPEPSQARSQQPDAPKPASPSLKARRATPPLPTRPVARPAPPSDPELPTFRVARVEVGDILNVREGPSEYHTPVGGISPDGRGIKIVGSCRGVWCPIRHGRVSGWVNAYYLAAERPGPAALAGYR